ncbi:arylamine N-acetyltransferase family protein [Negadavirga shengliensis]|uniref:Arylamine N-acetyltransferase n=1 Tax=Negadavirga shengliensis TaxID=1389218 RepID=A0ABV9T416_9BACT
MSEQAEQNTSGQAEAPIEKDQLQAYFERIGYQAKWSATLDCFRTIHRLHPQCIPFENLNPFLRIPVRLGKDDLVKKLIHDQRGGYCFEHNLLFGQVLKSLGFRVKGLAARILWNAPVGAITPRGHMLLLVEAEEQTYLADVGFGGLTLTSPLLLQPDLEQETPHELFRLIMDRDQYVLQVSIKEVWKSVYSFSLEEQFQPDYEVTNWYLSNHPDSHFVTGLIAARSAPGVRYALRNSQLSVHYVEGPTEKRVLESAGEIKRVLQDTFQIRLPKEDELGNAFERIILP